MLVKNKYLLGDYMQDRAKNNAGVTFAPKTGAANFLPHSVAIGAQGTDQATTGNQTAATAPVRQRPRNYVAVEVKDDVVQKSASEGLSEDVAVTKSDLTTADVESKMNNALQDLMDFTNRKFQYNAKESPLYTILEQQAAKEARLAAGRAYSRATANTGGFGSSYATLAAEEASRQVMAGLDDQQLALYEAAKAEFDSQWQTKLEQYNALSQIYNNQKVDEAETTQIMTDAINTLRERYGAEYVEEAMRADLSAMGLTEEQIGQALANQKQYSDAIGAYTNQTQSGVSDEVLAATQYLQSKYGSDYSEAAMRAELQAAGYNEADITAALEAQRKIASGSVMDYGAGTMAEALSWSSQLDLALRNGTLTESEYNQAKSENSAVIRTEVENAMKDEAKAAKYLLSAEQAVASGALLVEDYQKILVKNAQAELKDIEKGKGTDLRKAKKVLAVVNAILVDVDNGVMTEDEAYAVIREIAKTSAGKDAYGRISEIGNSDKESIRRLDKEEEEAYRALATAISANRAGGVMR